MGIREITEKEFAVIREISTNHLPDQRTISAKTGFSLGLTNLIIKRLIKKGYLKAKQLNRRKIQYILTPKGFAEKAKKSYKFALKTINLFKTVKEKIQELILNYYNNGAKEFVIVGNDELADLTEIAFRTIANLNNIKYCRPDNFNSLGKLSAKNNSVVFYTNHIAQKTSDKTMLQNNSINLIDYLSISGIFL